MTRIALAMALLAAAGGARAAQVADWQFQGTLMDSLGAPALAPLLPNDGGFVVDIVGNGNRTVRSFNAGGGFQVSAAGLVADTAYTVALLMRFNDTSSYRKIFDTRARGSDLGLYAVGGNLRLYSIAGGSGDSDAFTAAEWHQVVLVREAGGQVRGYLDGYLQFAAPDTADASAILQPDNLLTFLADDTVTTSEQTGGAVARIRLWDTALPEAQIAGLDDNQGDRIFIDGFETF